MKQGGRLASISSKEENDQIKELIRRNVLDEQVWLSGTDYPTGEWVWTSLGTPVTLTDWHNLQPDNHKSRPEGEHCMTFWNNNGILRWNDRNCLDELHSVCEYSEPDHYAVNWKINDSV
ncbi:lectin subunit alpha-like [Homalodisca vitripennis]|uniref:lectin subunit alpha-like n=1 Tax=Homalodisca vitripennis TaxID=197043 RepID=UPI001EEA6FC2|nr:lectin subunit alpha-like [Homalodisca vitripennis]XP_046667118.1 lectin subunit alpha-like [Homalodisca vitripennis]